MADDRVEAEASRLFARLQQDPAALDGPLKTTWLDVIAKNATAEQWNQLLAMARNSKSSVERSTYYALLGRASDQGLAKKALNLALTDEPGKTVSAGMISAVAESHPDLAVDFFFANEAKIAPLIDDSARARYLAGLGRSSQDPAMITKLERYAARQDPDTAKPILRTVGVLKEGAKVRPRTLAQVKTWLARQ